MTADYVQQNQTKTLIAHGRISPSSRLPMDPKKGFELTREEDFINGDMDMFDLLARNSEKHTVWRMRNN